MMKSFVSFFIFSFIAFSFCFGQNITTSINHTLSNSKLGNKYTKWQWNFGNQKSFVFRQSLQNPKISFQKTILLFNANKNELLERNKKYKRVHLYLRSGQRLNKALSFSSKAFVQQIPERLPFFSEKMLDEDRISFFKVALETVKAPETRIGVFNNMIMRNDTHRTSNIISSNIDARLRSYSAINQRTNLFLLGLNIAI